MSVSESEDMVMVSWGNVSEFEVEVCNFRFLPGGSGRVSSVCHEIRRLPGVRTGSEGDLEGVRFRELLDFGVVFDSFG